MKDEQVISTKAMNYILKGLCIDDDLMAKAIEVTNTVNERNRWLLNQVMVVFYMNAHDYGRVDSDFKKQLDKTLDALSEQAVFNKNLQKLTAVSVFSNENTIEKLTDFLIEAYEYPIEEMLSYPKMEYEDFLMKTQHDILEYFCKATDRPSHSGFFGDLKKEEMDELMDDFLSTAFVKYFGLGR